MTPVYCCRCQKVKALDTNILLQRWLFRYSRMTVTTTTSGGNKMLKQMVNQIETTGRY
jgi:hypothetical protein